MNVVGPARSPGYGPSTRALQGYEQACLKYDLPYRAVNAVQRLEELQHVTHLLLDQHPEITALITHHGPEVAGIVRAVQQRGLSLPQDISVVSIISDRVAELITPPITAISFPAHQMGLRAAQMMTARLQNPDYEAQQVMLRPRLVVRESTGPAPHS
jgi:DNA-binding LacI/PurR family transcriptional regulator